MYVYIHTHTHTQTLGAQCTNSCTLKGTVGHEAVVGTGVGLGLSSMPLPTLSHLGPQSPFCRQPTPATAAPTH